MGDAFAEWIKIDASGNREEGGFVNQLYLNALRLLLAELLEVRELLFRELPMALSEAHRSFLLSLVKAEPDWDLMPFPHFREMPAIRWKLQNLEKLRSTNPMKFKEQSDNRHAAFEQ